MDSLYEDWSSWVQSDIRNHRNKKRQLIVGKLHLVVQKCRYMTGHSYPAWAVVVGLHIVVGSCLLGLLHMVVHIVAHLSFQMAAWDQELVQVVAFHHECLKRGMREL
jgi:hypothetical protein